MDQKTKKAMTVLGRTREKYKLDKTDNKIEWIEHNVIDGVETWGVSWRPNLEHAVVVEFKNEWDRDAFIKMLSCVERVKVYHD